ncbi:Heterokaryon incompatibility protein (HET) domain containing protein [Rhypophila decipiens]
MQKARSAEMGTHQLNRLCEIYLSNFPLDRPWPWLIDHMSLENITIGDIITDGVVLQQPSSNIQLLESAMSGCHLCTMLLEALFPEKAVMGLQKATGIEAWAGPGAFQIRMLWSVDNWVLQIRHMTGDFGESLGEYAVKDLCLDMVHYPAIEEIPHQTWMFDPQRINPSIRIAATQPLSDTNVTPIAIQQMRDWLWVCREEHVDCRAAMERDLFLEIFPFRLIDVGTSGLEDDRIHLVDVEGRSRPESLEYYCTLSYRWTAETSATSLRTENKAEFHRSIPTQNWPKIYWDAVVITRQLGVSYLWIDALCIIQNDDDDDWTQQAALMSKIYGGGLLNFAGVEADRGTGLEVSRSPLRVVPCLLTLTLPDSSKQRLLMHRPDDIRKAVDRSPLYKRGWCFQEWVLSRRTVHFADQLFWECLTLRASETFPLISDIPGRLEYLDNWIQPTRKALWTKATPQEGSIHRLWCSVLRFYTQTQLSKPEDRLIAIQGVAKRLARQYGLSFTADYLAGLWRPHMAIELLWARESETYSEQDCELADKLAALFPSWSWASCPGEARFLQPFDTFLSQYYIRVDSTDTSNNNELAPESSHIVLRGWCVRSRGLTELLAGTVPCLEFPWSLPGNVAFHVELDRPVTNRESHLEVCHLPVMSELGRISGLILGDTGQLRCGMRVFCRLGVFKGSGSAGDPLMRALVPGWDGDEVGEKCDRWSPFMLV